MSLLLFILFGFVVGLIARAILPGRQNMSLVMTTLLGIAGSFLGGFVASLFTHHSILELNTSGLIGSVLGAIALLLLTSSLMTRRARPVI